MSKTTKYGILVIISVFLFLICTMIINMNDIPLGVSVAWSLLPMMIIIVIGVSMIESSNSNENYEDDEDTDSEEDENKSSCNQTINIYQYCSDNSGKKPKPKPKPIPIQPIVPSMTGMTGDNGMTGMTGDNGMTGMTGDNGMTGMTGDNGMTGMTGMTGTSLQPSDVQDWISYINPNLTDVCQICIIKNVINLWSVNDLLKVRSMDTDKQKLILNSILADNCEKICSVSLNTNDVMSWIMKFSQNNSEQCLNCPLNSIMKLWSVEDFAKVKSSSEEEQNKIYQALLKINCPECLDNKLKPEELLSWLTTVLPDSNQDCLNCVMQNLINVWNTNDLANIKSQNLNTQIEIIASILGNINCSDFCVSPLDRVSPNDAYQWIGSLLNGETPRCINCLKDIIVKSWSNTLFNDIKNRTKSEQNNLLQALIKMNCNNICYPENEKLTLEDIEKWLKVVLPNLENDCQGCIAENAFKMWQDKMPTKQEFYRQVVSLPCKEQFKLAKLIADFNCSHLCSVPGLDNCN